MHVFWFEIEKKKKSIEKQKGINSRLKKINNKKPTATT